VENLMPLSDLGDADRELDLRRHPGRSGD